MTGLGAWSVGYYRKGMPVPNDRVAAGLVAFKQALIDSGFGSGVNLDAHKFGAAMERETRRFQTNEGIAADGVIGPTTARHLFRHYTYKAEDGGTIKIPGHLLQRLGGQESGHDPVAEGYVDPDDEGWAQINLPNHPTVTVTQAWTPSFAIPWAAHYLMKFYVNEAADWDGAVASYNIGYYEAKQWVNDGKPATGPVMGGVDYYARASHYVAGVKAQLA